MNGLKLVEVNHVIVLEVADACVGDEAKILVQNGAGGSIADQQHVRDKVRGCNRRRA